jgi:hypothetical protein
VEVEAAHVEAVVGTGGGGSHGGWSHRHGGWRQGSVEDGGAYATVEKGAATVDPEKGAAAVVKEVGGRAPHIPTSDVLASDILASSPVSCNCGDLGSDVLVSSPVRCNRGFQRPRVVALTSSRRRRRPRVELYEEREGKDEVKKKVKISFGERSEKIWRR